MNKIIKLLVIGFTIIVVLGLLSGCNSDSSTGEATPTSTKVENITTKEGNALGYDYTIMKGEEDNRYVAFFSPFLARNDTIMLGMMFEMVNKTYGERRLINSEPELVERNGVNLIKFGGVDGNYYFLIIKQETDEVIKENGKEFIGRAGEIYSFIYWVE